MFIFFLDKENTDPKTSDAGSLVAVDDEIRQVFGDDPAQTNKVEATIHPSFKPHWKYWVTSGVKKEEVEGLVNKYEPEDCFRAPTLNAEVRATLTESATKRDGHFEENQKMLGSALTSLGSAMTMILNEPQGGFNGKTFRGWKVGGWCFSSSDRVQEGLH